LEIIELLEFPKWNEVSGAPYFYPQVGGEVIEIESILRL
jgi:hypothetical protein